MAWYWWTGICVYIAIGFYLAGGWMNEEGIDIKEFLFSLLIGVGWPIFMGAVLYTEFKQQILDFFVSPIMKWTGFSWLHEKWKDRNSDEEFDKDERMGYRDYWNV